MFVKVFCHGPAATNTILLGCTKTHKAAIIDAPPGSGEDSLVELEKEGFTPSMLLLTHSHWDHTADIGFLKEKTGAPLYVHELDAENVKDPGSDGLPLMMPIQPARPDHLLRGGETLQLGDLTLQVIHTPGHSPGGVCFYIKNEHTLISGDTLFKGSIGRTDFPSSDPEAMWISLEKLAQLPPNTRVIPGHGEETTIGEESWLPQAKHYFGG